MHTTDFLSSVLLEGLFSAIAAVGFASVSNPPKASFLYVPILGGFARMLRFTLIHQLGVELALATFFAAAATGFVGFYFARKARCPMEIFTFPALLPMIPGFFAYRSLLGMIRFMQAESEAVRSDLLPGIITNAITATTIMFALAIGVAVPLFMFFKHSFRMTRGAQPRPEPKRR